MVLKERIMLETTFEIVRRVIASGYEEEVDPETIKPESTFEELGLIEYIFGSIPTFVDLEDEFRKQNPGFQFPMNEIGDEEGDGKITVQQVVDLIDKELAKVVAGQ